MIALKILGVYVFLQFLMMLPTGLGVFQMSNAMGDSEGTEAGHVRQFALMAEWFLIVAAVYLTLAVGTFVGAHRLARFFVADPEDRVTLGGPVSDQLLAVAFQCLGVYALVTWTPGLVQTIVRCTIYGTWVDPQTPFLRRFYDNGSGLVSPSVGVVMGLLLIFRGKGLLRLIRLARPMSPERMTMG
ncbi:MAG: hypothetical protein IT368_15145 [Candidatus Hydrogenedentes bacterium]|nr:hypothetical protein [Candidatus Hydrogenedentota bacterium]